MGKYRRSYMKTVVLAAITGTGCLLVAMMFLCTVGEWSGLLIVHQLPFVFRIIVGTIFIVLALFGCTVAVGGMLALHYDAKGRAVF